MGTDAFSGNPAYVLEVTASLQSQNVAGNYSTVYYRMRVLNGNGGGYWATTNMGNSGWLDSNTGGGTDLWNNGNLAYDFRGGTAWTIKEGTFRVYHRSDGTAEYWVNGKLDLYALGVAQTGSGTRSLPSLAKAPPAPTPLGIDLVDQDSFRYKFQGNGDGGSAILEWQIGYGGSSSLPQLYLKSSGTSTISKLKQGFTYFVWSRGRNAVGWGPWSARSVVTTYTGSRVKVSGVWEDAVPYVKVNGVWKMAQPYVKTGGIWKPTS